MPSSDLLKLGLKHPKKQVNVGYDGQTPKREFEYERSFSVDENELAEDDGFKLRSNKVFMGKPGETPKTEFIYKETDPSTITRETKTIKSNFSPPPKPTKDQALSIEGQNGRPKTSRGKAHPSPDEYFDYVVPSPYKNHQSGVMTLDKGHVKVNESVDSTSSQHELSTKELNHQMHVSNDHRKERIRVLGCWLFGSALRI